MDGRREGRGRGREGMGGGVSEENMDEGREGGKDGVEDRGMKGRKRERDYVWEGEGLPS